MGNHRNLDVLDAADLVADEINRLIDHGKGRLMHVAQLRKSAQSIGANISEGFGRGRARERDHKLRVAGGETEETIRHLRANFAANRIERADFWRIRNRLITITRMLTSLLHESPPLDPDDESPAADNPG